MAKKVCESVRVSAGCALAFLQHEERGDYQQAILVDACPMLVATCDEGSSRTFLVVETAVPFVEGGGKGGKFAAKAINLLCLPRASGITSKPMCGFSQRMKTPEPH